MKSVSELADHLKYIIREEKNLDPPTEPKLKIRREITLPVLGTLSKRVMETYTEESEKPVKFLRCLSPST